MAEDPTRFVERGFTWIENKEHSIRLLDRNDPKRAISIAWADLPSLRELIVLALGDDKLKGAATPPSLTEPESGWLIEKMKGGEIWYVTVDQLLTWTTDSLKALRLARQKDAEMLCEIIEDAEKVAEHQWG